MLLMQATQARRVRLTTQVCTQIQSIMYFWLTELELSQQLMHQHVC